LSLINTSGITDVSALRTISKPTEVTVSGSLEAVEITDRHVVLTLTGGGFKITAVADRRMLEASTAP
jgi:tRNA(Ile2) C34 agmatinyltransferase TiaS